MWVLALAWLGCGTEPAPPDEAPEPGASSLEAPVPIAAFPAALAPAVLDARPAVFAHAEAGPCAECHTAQTQAWTGSDHDRALGSADRALGAFDGQPVSLRGLTATPSMDGHERTLTVADGAGERTYRVRHTFGHDPLQQLLLEGVGGALLVAPIAWDAAGARWYDPAPDGVAADPADPLYWAGLFGTWNHMCATCHSTGVVEGFDASSGVYDTTWTHEDVGCQACHGAGPDVRTLASGADQDDTCGSCHSLRGPLAPGFAPGAPLLDHFTPTLLDSDVYAADGSTQDDREAFVWGSFQQSAMAAAGVRCTHCHEPHSGQLVAQGNALCTTCHDSALDAGAHDGGRDCVDCHMPERTYMGLDTRRDHAFEVPGRDRGPLAPAVVARARTGDASTGPALLAVVGDSDASPFHRASALALLRRQPPPGQFGQVLPALGDESALVRWQGAELFAAWSLGEALWPLLADPVRAVRFSAAKGLLSGGAVAPDEASTAQLAAVSAELQAALGAEADEPASHLNLAVLHAVAGDLDRAIAAAETAVRLAPAFPAARQMLAGLLHQAGRTAEAQAVLDGG